MKRSVLIASVLGLALLVFLFLRFTRTNDATVRPELAGPTADGSPATLEGVNRDRATDLAPLAPEAERSAETASKHPSDPAVVARTIRGRVLIAGGCADPDLEVFAVVRKGGEVSLNDLLDDPEHTLRDADAEDDEEDETDEASPARIVARAKVDAEGAFTLDLPIDGVVQLEARGRFVSTTFARRVEKGDTEPVLLAGECGTCLVGRIVAPAGHEAQAREKTPVRVRSAIDDMLTGNAVSRRIMAVDGRFELRAVPVARQYEVDVSPGTLASNQVTVSDCVVGQAREFDVALGVGGTLAGLVRDASGAPVPDAEVAAKRQGKWFGLDDRKVRKTRTKPDGTFRLEGVALGDVRLDARAAGFLAGEALKLKVAEGATLDGLVLELGSGASMRGVVTWEDGRPAAGALVRVEFDKAQMFGLNAMNARKGARGGARTDAEGRFTVKGLGPGPFTVHAGALTPEDAAAIPETETAQRAKHEHRARLDGVKPGSKELKLALSPPQGLSGRVVEADGKTPVRSFEVRAVLGKSGVLGDLGLDTVEETIENEKGEFRLDLPRAGTWRLVASGRGFAASDVVEVAMPRAADAGEVAIQLVRCAVVKGVVRDSRGAPAVGAEVNVSTGDPAWRRAMPGWNQPRALSRADGTFTLEGLRPGKFEIQAESKSWAPSAAAALELTAGETRENVELRLTEGGSITGEVYADGKPAVGHFVQITNTKSQDQRGRITDGEGRFSSTHLAPGTYQVVALPKSALGGEDGQPPNQAAILAQAKMASTPVVEGQEAHLVLGAPPEEPVRVHGTVTHAGAPYVGAAVMFVGDKKDVLSSLKSATVGADGAYQVELDGPGRYAVTVQRAGGGDGEQQSVEFTRTIPSGKEHRLDLRMPNGRISGRVQKRDGEPAAKVTVTVISSEGLRTGSLMGGQYANTTTDADGRYDVQTLRPGLYTVQAGTSIVDSLFGAGAEHGRATLHDVKLAEEEWKQDVDLRLKDPATVRVKVVDESGAPVRGASVFARDEDGRLVDVLSVVATDNDGVGRYEGLGEGHFTFQARIKDRASADSPRVTLKSGETKDLQLELRDATRLVVRVQDASGALADARVSVFDEAGRDVAAMFSLSELQDAITDGTMSRDVQRIGPLPRGKYKVRAISEDGKTVEKSVTLSGQAERSITLKFE